jgi:hypothetical protein
MRRLFSFSFFEMQLWTTAVKDGRMGIMRTSRTRAKSSTSACQSLPEQGVPSRQQLTTTWTADRKPSSGVSSADEGLRSTRPRWRATTKAKFRAGTSSCSWARSSWKLSSLLPMLQRQQRLKKKTECQLQGEKVVMESTSCPIIDRYCRVVLRGNEGSDYIMLLSPAMS